MWTRFIILVFFILLVILIFLPKTSISYQTKENTKEDINIVEFLKYAEKRGIAIKCTFRDGFIIIQNNLSIYKNYYFIQNKSYYKQDDCFYEINMKPYSYTYLPDIPLYCEKIEPINFSVQKICFNFKEE